MCGSSMARVRGVIAAATASTITCWLGGGTGNEICFTTMPSRRSRCVHDVSMRG